MGWDSLGERALKWQRKPRLVVVLDQTKLSVPAILNVSMSVEK